MALSPKGLSLAGAPAGGTGYRLGGRNVHPRGTAANRPVFGRRTSERARSRPRALLGSGRPVWLPKRKQKTNAPVSGSVHSRANGGVSMA